MTHTAELLFDARASLGEGALWDSRRNRLYWVDILGCALHVLDPEGPEDRAFALGQHVTTAVPRARGGVVLGLHHGIGRFDLSTGELEILCDPEAGIPNNRFNDGKCDPAGRFWAGTMDMEARPGAGSLYCLDADLRCRQMLTSVSISNGLAWSLDCRTMYYIDTLTWELAAFDYDPGSGDIGNRRIVAHFTRDQGHPDGMTVDADGMLWVAMCGGGRVLRIDPLNGATIDQVLVPASLVTSCALGGRLLDTLYVTTARVTLDDGALREQPHAGGIFQARPGVRGIPAFEFAG